MQKRDFTYLSAELHEVRGQVKLNIRRFSPTHSGANGLERLYKAGDVEEGRDICMKYWWAISERLENIFVNNDADYVQQQAIEIRELSVNLSDELFDEETLSFIFEVARETEVLVILTSLIEVPWEALINPREMNGTFLSEYCIVSRSFTPQEMRSRTFQRNSVVEGRGLYVDAVLLHGWGDVHDANHRSFKRLCRNQNPIAGRNVDELFRAMESKKVIQWICENSFDGSVDRLRVAENSFFTRSSLLTHSISEESIVVLMTCCPANQKRAHEPIAALLSSYNGCTVICSLVPISEKFGIRALRIFRYVARRVVRNGSKLTLEAFINELRQKRPAEGNSIESLIGLFLGIYGTPRVDLGAII